MYLTVLMSISNLKVVVFAVSWLPFHAFQLAIDIDSSVLVMRDFRLLYTVFHIVAMCSTFTNPLLYGWMNRNYRSAFMAAFRCDKQLSSAHPGGPNTMTVHTKKAPEVHNVLVAQLNATEVWGNQKILHADQSNKIHCGIRCMWLHKYNLERSIWLK